jgi:hypothetical protein
MEKTKKLHGGLGVLGIATCVILCSLPVIGGALGIGGLIAAATYFEKIGMGVLILSLGLLGVWLYKKLRAK